MDNLRKLINELESEKVKIQERRDYWNNQLRDILRTQLKYYVENIKSDWYVDFNNNKTNYETVSLAFGNRPSGIFDREEGRHLSLIGGALHFSQIYNGKIFIWIEYPYIEDLSYHDPSQKGLKTLEPIELTEEVVLNVVEDFIRIIIESENRERQLIGFKS